MKWIEYLGEPHLVLQPDDLRIAEPLIARAEKLWKRFYRDLGTIVIGSGIATLYLPPRKRKPVRKLLIASPGQGNGSDSAVIPLNFLNRYGIPCFFEEGRAD